MVTEITKTKDSWNECLNSSLATEDPEIFALVEQEKDRQYSGLELIASENFTSQAVMEACGSCFTNKYSEGLPGQRYYGGNEHVDAMENLCRRRALEAFGLDPQVWGVNVQPYSGSPANFAVFTGMLKPHDRIMGLDLPSGGHLTHGYQTAKKKISATSVFFESMPYQVDNSTGYIDYDALEKSASLFRPKMLICGASAYPRDMDYERLRKIADANLAFLMCDMAHVAGLVAGGHLKSPFEFCDVVTSTTHKTLRGPRSGVIFFRKVDLKGNPTDYESRINQAVFPGCQGGPHNHAIAGVAVAMKQVGSPDFKEYGRQVVANSRSLAEALMDKGYKLVTDGTDNHVVLWDLRPLKLTGSKYEKICDLVHITVNKNAVHGDVSALSPGGVRLGTPALTSRSFKEQDFKEVAHLLERAVNIALACQENAGSKMLKDFVGSLPTVQKDLDQLKADVMAFARRFPMPGFSVDHL